MLYVISPRPLTATRSSSASCPGTSSCPSFRYTSSPAWTSSLASEITYRIIHVPGVLKRVDQANPPLNPLYFGVFLMFCACLTIQYGRFFILVLLGHIIEKICWKIATSKRLNFRVCSIWQFSEIYFFWFFVHNILPNHAKLKCWGSIIKFRKFAAKWAQKFSKLMEKCPR